MSLPKIIDAFWYPSHPSMIKFGWSKWGKVTLLHPKRSLWFLLKIEVIRCNFLKVLAWNFLTYSHLIHQNIYVKNNLESPDTVVRHSNAFLEYLKPLESVLSRFYFYFHRKKLKNTTNIESLHKFNEDGISTCGGHIMVGLEHIFQ